MVTLTVSYYPVPKALIKRLTPVTDNEFVAIMVGESDEPSKSK